MAQRTKDPPPDDERCEVEVTRYRRCERRATGEREASAHQLGGLRRVCTQHQRTRWNWYVSRRI
jgi:hypothetical protein